MKNIINVFLAFLLLTILAGCNNKKEAYELVEFPEVRSLSGTLIDLEIKYIGCHVHVHDTLLFLTNSHNDDYQIHVYNKNSFELITKSALTGRGPGELSAPFYATLDTIENCIWIPDMGNRVIRKYMIDSIMNYSYYVSQSTIEMPKDVIIMYYAPCVNQTFSYRDWDHTRLISFFDRYGTIADSLTVNNRINLYSIEDISPEIEYMTTYYIYAISPELDKIAIAYCYSDYLAIINMDGDVLHRLSGPDGVYQIPDNMENNQTITTQYMRSDSDHIFCLYSGKPRFKDESNMIPAFPGKIYVYNWKGEPVVELDLEFDAQSFDMDYQNKRIITFSPECNTVVYYNFDVNDL